MVAVIGCATKDWPNIWDKFNESGLASHRGRDGMSLHPFEAYEDYEDDDDSTVECVACNGTGINIEGGDCRECDGNGYFEI